MSGLTSAGLSVASDASELPRTLQFWRSWLEWVGGIGLVLAVLPLVETTEDAYDLYGSELNVDTLESETDQTVRWIWGIYVGYTALGVGLFWALGMPIWEALNHAMTGMATGGFSVTSDSFRSYSPALKLAAVFVMTLGAMSFLTHYRLVARRDWRKVAHDAQTRWLFALLIGGFALLLLINRQFEGAWLPVDTLFQWASALGTCGFNSVELSAWSSAALFFLVIAMFVGAAAGSTGGGLKVQRLAILVRSVGWRLRGMDTAGDQPLLPDAPTYDEDRLRQLQKAVVILVLFLITLALGVIGLFVFTGDAHSVRDLLFEATSALGAVGLSAGVTSPDLPAGARFVLIVLMWAGRLEVLAVLALLLSPLRRRADA